MVIFSKSHAACVASDRLIFCHTLIKKKPCISYFIQTFQNNSVSGVQCRVYLSKEKQDLLWLKILASLYFEQKFVFLSLARQKASPAISHWAAVRSHCSAISGFADSGIYHSQDEAPLYVTGKCTLKRQSILRLLKIKRPYFCGASSYLLLRRSKMWLTMQRILQRVLIDYWIQQH